MLPYVMTRSMFDEVLDSAFSGHSANGMMNTDIKESKDGYELIIDLPGVSREDLSAELKNGYLIISATVGQKKDTENENAERYLQRERFVGSFKRSFYVGTQLKSEDMRAKFDQGVLHLWIPKVTAVPQIEQRNLISIEP